MSIVVGRVSRETRGGVVELWGDGFLKTVFLLIVVEELVFHMEHCF